MTAKWHDISDVSYVVTSESTSRAQLSDQFLKHFAVIHWNSYRYHIHINFIDKLYSSAIPFNGFHMFLLYSSNEMVQIFDTILNAQFCSDKKRCPSNQPTINSLVQTVIQVHRRLSTMFLRNLERLHYLFSMNHIAAVFR